MGKPLQKAQEVASTIIAKPATTAVNSAGELINTGYNAINDVGGALGVGEETQKLTGFIQRPTMQGLSYAQQGAEFVDEQIAPITRPIQNELVNPVLEELVNPIISEVLNAPKTIKDALIPDIPSIGGGQQGSIDPITGVTRIAGRRRRGFFDRDRAFRSGLASTLRTPNRGLLGGGSSVINRPGAKSKIGQ